MNALVDVRLAEGAVRPRKGCGQRTGPGRRRPRTAPTGRMTQPARLGRPLGVRAPRVRPRTSRALRNAPPAALELGVRLSDRGIALALGLILTLVVAALVCIGSTALRVTADPSPGLSAAAPR